MADASVNVKVTVVGMEPFAAFLRTIHDVHQQLSLITLGPAVIDQFERLGKALTDLREATTDDEDGTNAVDEAGALGRYQDALADGLSDHEAREEGWPSA
jgi:hypothetical protein